MRREDAWRMVRRRGTDARIEAAIGRHTSAPPELRTTSPMGPFRGCQRMTAH